MELICIECSAVFKSRKEFQLHQNQAHNFRQGADSDDEHEIDVNHLSASVAEAALFHEENEKTDANKQTHRGDRVETGKNGRASRRRGGKNHEVDHTHAQTEGPHIPSRQPNLDLNSQSRTTTKAQNNHVNRQKAAKPQTTGDVVSTAAKPKERNQKTRPSSQPSADQASETIVQPKLLLRPGTSSITHAPIDYRSVPGPMVGAVSEAMHQEASLNQQVEAATAALAALSGVGKRNSGRQQQQPGAGRGRPTSASATLHPNHLPTVQAEDRLPLTSESTSIPARHGDQDSGKLASGSRGSCSARKPPRGIKDARQLSQDPDITACTVVSEAVVAAALEGTALNPVVAAALEGTALHYVGDKESLAARRNQEKRDRAGMRQQQRQQGSQPDAHETSSLVPVVQPPPGRVLHSGEAETAEGADLGEGTATVAAASKRENRDRRARSGRRESGKSLSLAEAADGGVIVGEVHAAHLLGTVPSATTGSKPAPWSQSAKKKGGRGGGSAAVSFVSCTVCSSHFYSPLVLRHHMLAEHPGVKLAEDSNVPKGSFSASSKPSRQVSPVVFADSNKGIQPSTSWADMEDT
ncbi:hypothetical protein CEUSTIGMA_g3808.t1 [Chlamydomonas eustigma]|uniref:C2H2-type domain-containing protein n=1 Tax=Chlamydomonas eustigma TaxID=1157962 RepID=A0A250X0E3_9CHLO|nr:hypothetical protein CEUSTIGMA_g3808.t1 [Chlamydomonas eustigma]|eukprot:GAX76362.1 hypothetical protein CEUSTIGMA_g3808.t1 [Chlamydomonas eustigma]